MNFKVACAAMVGLTVMAALAGAGSESVWAQGSKTQWDGIYTADQSKRGEAVYNEICSPCHGSDLTGSDMAPGLTGNDFAVNWNDLTVGDLFERIRISMPQNKPGSLTRQQVADVLAFVLEKGNYPAGTAELPLETDVLNTVKFVATKP